MNRIFCCYVLRNFSHSRERFVPNARCKFISTRLGANSCFLFCFRLPSVLTFTSLRNVWNMACVCFFQKLLSAPLVVVHAKFFIYPTWKQQDLWIFMQKSKSTLDLSNYLYMLHCKSYHEQSIGFLTRGESKCFCWLTWNIVQIALFQTAVTTLLKKLVPVALLRRSSWLRKNWDASVKRVTEYCWRSGASSWQWLQTCAVTLILFKLF